MYHLSSRVLVVVILLIDCLRDVIECSATNRFAVRCRRMGDQKKRRSDTFLFEVISSIPPSGSELTSPLLPPSTHNCRFVSPPRRDLSYRCCTSLGAHRFEARIHLEIVTNFSFVIGIKIISNMTKLTTSEYDRNDYIPFIPPYCRLGVSNFDFVDLIHYDHGFQIFPPRARGWIASEHIITIIWCITLLVSPSAQCESVKVCFN